MSEIITFPLPVGTNYVIPDVGDENWGQNVTDFLVAIPSGVMPTSGTFSLTGDVSFGPTFGLVSQYFKTATTIPATAGFLRLSKTDSIDWRNNANSADLALAINGSDQLTFAGTPITVGGVTSITGTANQIIASAATGAVTLSTPQSIATTSSPTFAALTLSAPLTVPNGGTGGSSFTAYALLCGGTTSTNPLQSVGTTGLSGQFLQSQGAGFLPIWANAAGTGTVNSGTAGNLSLYPASTNAVSDTYVQNTKNITVGIASQTGRTVDLALTIPNPGNAVAAASVVLTQGGQTLTGPYTFGTNQVTFPNGSQLLPSICFSGDNTTGFNYASGTIQVPVSASEVFQFTSTENRSYRPLSMQSQKITSLSAGTTANDALAYGQSSWSLGAGTLTGALAMSAQKITGLAAGTAATDAVNFSQLGVTNAHSQTGTTAGGTAIALPSFSITSNGGPILITGHAVVDITSTAGGAASMEIFIVRDGSNTFAGNTIDFVFRNLGNAQQTRIPIGWSVVDTGASAGSHTYSLRQTNSLGTFNGLANYSLVGMLLSS